MGEERYEEAVEQLDGKECESSVDTTFLLGGVCGPRPGKGKNDFKGVLQGRGVVVGGSGTKERVKDKTDNVCLALDRWCVFVERCKELVNERAGTCFVVVVVIVIVIIIIVWAWAAGILENV